jgi:hypothetical protein
LNDKGTQVIHEIGVREKFKLVYLRRRKSNKLPAPRIPKKMVEGSGMMANARKLSIK